MWIAAETLPQWQAIFPQAALRPTLEPPAEFAAKAWTRDDALVEILRGRLACSGVTDAAALATALALPRTDIDSALAMLEREGTAMRGSFTPGAASEEWCERGLLARIHRRTLQRLRREIEPVPPRDFLRFLCDWQHLAPDARLRGPDALVAVLAQLEGFEAAAGAWEAQILAARIAGYDMAWLDALCHAGRIAWTRLRASSTQGHAGPVRASPIVLLPRAQLAAWRAVAARPASEPPALSSRAQAVAEFLAQRGAAFFGEIADGTRLLKVELEDALGELVGAGMVGADSFAGLRALLLPAARRNHARHRRLARHLLNGIEDAGRWSLVRTIATPSQASPHPNPPPQAGEGDERPVLTPMSLPPFTVEEPAPETLLIGGARRAKGGSPAPLHAGDAEQLDHVARVLLRRWGVVFWKLLEREAAWLPPWRELRRVYQRLEARGEIRGGRFVDGIAGEQFALPEAVEALRRVHARAPDGALITVSGCDPLNLVGGVLAGAKVPALAASRIVYRDGVPVATRSAGVVELPHDLPADAVRAVHATLRGSGSLRRQPIPTQPSPLRQAQGRLEGEG